MRTKDNKEGVNMKVYCMLCDEMVDSSQAKYSKELDAWACNDCLEEDEDE